MNKILKEAIDERIVEASSKKLSKEELKKAIDDGDSPTVIFASWSKDHNSFGDLKDIGYAKRNVEYFGKDAEISWTYTGPKTITYDGKERKKGFTTDAVKD